MMNYIILFSLLLTYSTSSFAVDNGTGTSNSTGTETNLNQTLLQNAAASQNNNNPPTSIHILSNGGSSTTSPTNLTDQEKQLSQNYVHQGMANRIIQEKCVGEMQQACQGAEVDHKIMGMSPGLMKAASQAYATMGAMGDFMSLSAKPSADAAKPAADGAKDGAKKDKADDYCKYIPTLTETVAMFSQKNTVQGLSNGGETSQKEALLKAAKSHDNRAEQAQIQSYGWYAGAACYAYGAATSFAVDTALVVKLSASLLLGTFYKEEAGANKDYADKTRAIADALPGKGTCNPVTENLCYCSQPETQNDPTYCKAQIAARNAPSAFTRVACTNSNLQPDPSCACEKNNTCFDRFLQNQGAASLQIGMGSGTSPFQSVASIAHGRLENGVLNGTAANGLAAIAKRALSDFSSKVPAGGMLNPAQKAVADAIASKGIPSDAARLMALNSPSQSAINQAMAKVQGLGAVPTQLASYSPGKNGVVDFSGGNGLGIAGRRNEKKGDDFLAKFAPGAKGAANNAKVMEFAQRAEARAAQITKSDRPIFEIISLRYQTSGRRLLQLDSSN